MEDFAQGSTGGGGTLRGVLAPVARTQNLRLRYAAALLAGLCWPAAAQPQAEVSPAVQALYEKARAAQAANDEPAAIRDYEQMLKLAPDLAPAYNNLGRLLYNQGRFREAVEVIRRGLAVNPAMPQASVVLGASLLQLGRPADAVAPLEAGVGALPGDRFAHISLARAEMALDHPEQAMPQVDAILQVDAKDQEAWYLLGKLHLELSQRAFARVQQIGGNTALAHVLEGEIMESLENTPGAVDAYKQAIAAAPGDAGALEHLANLYWSTGDWAHAREQLTALLEKQPGSCTARWKLANSLDELGEPPASGLHELDLALSQCPGLPQAHAERARLLLREGKPALALDDLRIAEKAAPDEPSVQQLFSQTYRALGDREHADAANRRFQQLEAAERAAKERHAASVVRSNQ